MIRNYLNLIKPNIVIGNVTSTIGGFFLATQGKHFHISLLINTIIGLSLIIASSCVLNNIIDRDIDSVMKRTTNRILVRKKSYLKNSIYYASILIIFGLLFLSFTKKMLIILLAMIGVFIYIVVYSLWMKRTSIYSIIVGSISGAIPPVIGYCAVTNKFDTGAIILLLIYFLWQIPHSYSILILRKEDYKTALITTFPMKKGLKLTKNHMIIYIINFMLAIVLLTITGYTSYIFLCGISIFNALWLYTGLQGSKLINSTNIYYNGNKKNNHNNDKILLWAKKMFILSILVIILLNILLSLDNFLFHINQND